MREKAWVLLCWLFILFNSSFSFSQSASLPTDSASASNFLSTILSRTGWNNAPADATAVGMVRDAATPAGPGSPIRIQARGSAQLRY
jgi:hypothetical protein